MIKQLLVSLIPLAVLVAPLSAVIGCIYLWRRYETHRERESPLVHDLIRPPGHSLRGKIAELSDDVAVHFFAAMLIPTFAFAGYVCQAYYGGQGDSLPSVVAWTTTACAVLGAAIRLLILRLRELRRYRLGLEGELATGEELNQLMLDGCRVFHDVPFIYGNIDHVVISPSGVYSINTKMRGKPRNVAGNAEVVVDHQRNRLIFPDGDFPIPTEQLETEARWLSGKLNDALGLTLKVEPMLALPGWFIKERIGRGPVYVFNPRKPKRFFVQNSRTSLTGEQLQQIAHQVEQLCRDVAPSFKRERRWGSETASAS